MFGLNSIYIAVIIESVFVFGVSPIPTLVDPTLDTEMVGQAGRRADSPLFTYVAREETANDVSFTLTQNRYNSYSVVAWNCNPGRIDNFALDFANQRNLIYVNEDTNSRAEDYYLVGVNRTLVDFGSFRNEGPSYYTALPSGLSSAESHGFIAMGHGSQFARRFGNMMLSPSASQGFRVVVYQGWCRVRESPNPGFKMITNIIDPSIYCLDNSIVYTTAMEGDALRFRAKSALLPASNAGDVFGTNSSQPEIVTSRGEAYEVSFGNLSVSLDVAQALHGEIERVSGLSISEFETSQTCQSFIAQLPTLKFTVLEDDGSDVANLIFEPADYITIENGPSRFCRIDVIGTDGYEQSISEKFLRQVGLFVDYENRRFGFCDPR